MRHSTDNEQNEATREDDIHYEYCRTYKEALDMTVNEDDKALQNRFAEMRSRALDHIPQTEIGDRRKMGRWPAFGAISAVLVLAVVMLFPKSSVITEDYVLDDLDILTETEDLEMLAGHELEFYVWLEQELE